MSARSLVNEKKGHLQYLYSPEIRASGVEHGFLAGELDFSQRGLANSTPPFLATFGVKKLVLVNQVHGNAIAQFSWTQGLDIETADGIIIPVDGRRSHERMAFGIRTADCMTVLFVGSRNIALIHAGWRGLVNGILPSAIKAMNEKPAELSVAISPCAGGETYAVGEEVLHGIGPHAVTNLVNGQTCLDLKETASRILTAAGVSADRIYYSDTCTISDRSFHSYRRDGDHAGRNLSFVVV